MRRLGFALLLALTTPGALAAELVITVDRIRSDKGDIFVAVYAGPAEWPDKSVLANTQKQRAERGGVVFRLDLPPGIYAANGFHDENGNGKFDINFLGIPLEGYMFSNNVMPFLSAPSFASASFKLPIEGTSIAMRVRY
jgi:uncharacterized protein (DUF2141 family)